MYGGIAKSIISKAAATMTPTLIASMLANASITQMLSVSAGATFAAVGLAVPEVLSAWQEGRKTRRNGFAFLLNLHDPEAMLSQLHLKRALTLADRGILPTNAEYTALFVRSGFAEERPSNLKTIDSTLMFLIRTVFESKESRARYDAADFLLSFTQLINMTIEELNALGWIGSAIYRSQAP